MSWRTIERYRVKTGLRHEFFGFEVIWHVEAELPSGVHAFEAGRPVRHLLAPKQTNRRMNDPLLTVAA